MTARSRKGGSPLRRTDRWLVSYADFVTLLFSFFVVLFAAAEADRAAPRKVAYAVEAAFSRGTAAMQAQTPQSHPTSASAPVSRPELQNAFAVLDRELRSETETGRIHMHLEKRGLVISMSQAAYFPSGGDHIEPGLYPGILKIADSVRELPNRILLEGHTDSTLLRRRHFRDNWDLSAARATAMLRVLHDEAGIGRDRLSIAGYADTRPLVSNATAEGRSQNRRVDIVILAEPH